MTLSIEAARMVELEHQTRTDRIFRLLFSHSGGLWCADIAQRLREDPCDVTYSLKRMEQAGTVRREMVFRPKTGRKVWFYMLVTAFDASVWPDWSMVRVLTPIPLVELPQDEDNRIAHLDESGDKPPDETPIATDGRPRPCHPAQNPAFA